MDEKDGTVGSRTRKKTKNTKRKPILITLAVILAIIIGGITVWAVGIYNGINDLSKSEFEPLFPSLEPEEVVEVPVWEGKERVNILLLGVDARDQQPGELARSDSMLVASIDPVTKKAHLFSILRDTYLPIEGHGRGRINTAITLGRPELAMKTAGDLLGLDIQYYVYTDFEGFKALIDTIGGIYFEVEKNMRYTDNADGNRYDINLDKGYQLLDGDKALQYVRFRHDKMSDFTRTERQRNFLMAVAKELKSTWNIVKMKEILDSIKPYVHMNITPADILKLGQLGLDLSIAGSAQVPPMHLIADEKINGVGSVLAVTSIERVQQYVQEILAADESALEETDPNSNTATEDANSTGTSQTN
ncbi:LCP family protein [Paenibacillus yanchengensis]|uniref:LCP family protein n=1 Tax=Paenibacillus yanchengensis TaxID=2035833 RepID=A0ABW4YI88_9BACL